MQKQLDVVVDTIVNGGAHHRALADRRHAEVQASLSKLENDLRTTLRTKTATSTTAWTSSSASRLPSRKRSGAT